MPDAANTVYLKNYRPPAYFIDRTELDVALDFESTRVKAKHHVVRNTAADTATGQPLVLDTHELELCAIAIDGNALPPQQFKLNHHTLELFDPPPAFELTIENRISPQANTALSGLYKSGDMLCTQCEAEGFRRITPSIDRPDNLATYTVTLRAPRALFPQLLCNGNLQHHGVGAAADEHYAVWHDPLPKPTYLFAIVAGQLAVLEDHFTTRSQRRVALRVYARADDIDKCAYAMQALKQAMHWDEQVYGREYDLELFNVVAVSDFNMGAMENKSLNIFNTRYVLADNSIATDRDFQNIQAVVGHEYFHNWSGNRVTCRDWFQLCLKEGFTVFREQQFSADLGARRVKRIEDVDILRNHQFAEDAGPMAHAVRPQSYMEINNFYTTTVYNKGAEVVRMLHTIVGRDAFRRGTDLYFSRHDGQAVTTDDFVQAIQDASELSPALFGQFKRWYSQAGTPQLQVRAEYDAAKKQLSLHCRQHCAATPGQTTKALFVIPIKAALFDSTGNKLDLDGRPERLFLLRQRQQTFRIRNVAAPPLLSLLRDFSAPVELQTDTPPQQLAVLMACDDDAFNRWEAGQKLLLHHLLQAVQDKTDRRTALSPYLVDAFRHCLQNAAHDRALSARMLTPPSELYLSKQTAPIAPPRIHQARVDLLTQLVAACYQPLLDCYADCQAHNQGQSDPTQAAARSLRDACLMWLSVAGEDAVHHLAEAQLRRAADTACMTDAVSALGAMVRARHPQRRAFLDQFYTRWQHQPLVVDKWLSIQATQNGVHSLDEVEALTRHAAFDHTNPNKVYALLLAYSHANPLGFHLADGRGYACIANWVAKLDPLNPQVAARLVAAFNHWRQYTPNLARQMHAQLESLHRIQNLSPDVNEIVSKSLEGGDL